jgi:hypothetical protein
MSSRSSDVNVRRFEQVEAAFDRAWHAASGDRCESSYRFAGESARLRIVGQALANQVRPAIAHLSAAAASAPLLTIDLWDERESTVRGPVAPEHHAAGRTWRIGDGLFAASSDGRLVSHQLGRSVVWLDRAARRIVGWFADGRDLSLHQRGKPLQLLLALWASDRGLQAVHAALVARNGVGALIPGGSGAGKSTAALTCLRAGYRYFGDDWVGVGSTAGGAVVGHGLYNSLFLDPNHAERFPYLQPHIITPRDQSPGKSLILLRNLFPDQLGDCATIRALALPRIVTHAPTRVRPAAKRDALLVLVPSSVFAMHPRPGRDGIDRLARLVQQIPAYWLEIGDDLEEIPRRVDEILAAVGAGPSRH